MHYIHVMELFNYKLEGSPNTGIMINLENIREIRSQRQHMRFHFVRVSFVFVKTGLFMCVHMCMCGCLLRGHLEVELQRSASWLMWMLGSEPQS